MGTTTAAITSGALRANVLATSGAPTWRDDVAVVLLGCAAALFVVAGVVRLARWRLAGDPHCALVGCALIVMGGLFLPLVGVAEVSGALSGRAFAEACLRALVTFITAGLLLGAVSATSLRGVHRPTRLLPLLAIVVLANFAGLAWGEMELAEPLAHGPQLARGLSAVMVVTWLCLAVVVRRYGPHRPWSRRTPPLFVALAAAEALYGRDPGAPVGTGAALVVCTAVGVVAVWSAKVDLDAALQQTVRTIGSLSDTLRETRDEAVELTEWRAHLVHDATNSVAGLQAALQVLSARQDASDPPTADLCRAAAEEVRHLDHLLHRTPDASFELFDAGAVVRSVGLAARTLGHDVSVHADRALAHGRADDLVVVLKNLLANAARHAPDAPVDLLVDHDDGRVRVVCRDHGPGLDEGLAPHVFERGVRSAGSPGSGLGLYEARLLMRAQGGDLVAGTGSPGASFVATLPAAPAAGQVGAHTIPDQRTGPPLLDRPLPTEGVLR